MQTNIRSSQAARVTAFAFAIVVLIGLAGCANRRFTTVTVSDVPRSGPVRPYAIGRPVIALALSGGSARGFAHIGVIRAFEQMEIEPDLIVGTSACSIVGAVYAAEVMADELEVAAKRFNQELKIRPISVRLVGK